MAAWCAWLFTYYIAGDAITDALIFMAADMLLLRIVFLHLPGRQAARHLPPVPGGSARRLLAMVIGAGETYAAANVRMTSRVLPGSVPVRGQGAPAG